MSKVSIDWLVDRLVSLVSMENHMFLFLLSLKMLSRMFRRQCFCPTLRSFCSMSKEAETTTKASSEMITTKEEEKEIEKVPYEVIPGSGLMNAREVSLSQGMGIRVDPQHTSAILFPGIGSQHPGMGENLLDYPNVPELFETASRVLGYDILDICMNGTQDQLRQMDIAEAATFVTNLAAAEKLRFERPTAITRCVTTAGFSIGELSALVFAGSIDYEDALRLVKIRGDILTNTKRIVPSGLINVTFFADHKISLAVRSAQEFIIRKGVDPDLAHCGIAFYMFPHCKVIGGHDEALNFISENMQDFGITRVTRLPIEVALHTKIVKDGSKKFTEALKKVKVLDPLIPVYSNYDGKLMKTSVSVLEKLSRQLYSSSRLEQIFHNIYSRERHVHLPYTFECGPGWNMSKILEKVNGRAYRQSIRIYS